MARSTAGGAGGAWPSLPPVILALVFGALFLALGLSYMPS
jgi:hypothetical protein